MAFYLPTIIVRHRRENLKKCSLRGLEQRTDCLFYRYPSSQLPPAEGYILLGLQGEILSEKDHSRGLLLLDATWRYASKMYTWALQIPNLVPRSLPTDLRTAYPRRQGDCEEPERGLASIEALYVAYFLLKRPTEGILDNYIWKDDFLEKNQLI